MAGDRIQNFVNNAGDEQPAEESFSSKVMRETQLIGTGLIGVKEGAQQAAEDPAGTAARAGVALGIGFLASRYGAAESVGAQLLKTGMGAASISLLADVGVKSQRISDALTDNWKNDANWEKNAGTMKQDLGRFTFDTALMTGFGMAGGKLGATLRPTNSLFHENHIDSRTDVRVVGKGDFKSIAWDVNKETGLHKPLYSPKQLNAIHADTGIPLPTLEVINTATEATLTNSNRLLGARALSHDPSIELGRQVASDPILGKQPLFQGKPLIEGPLSDVLSMTSHFRMSGTFGDYFHTTPGVWPAAQPLGSRTVPRHFLHD
jgi:hypothetical protein